MKGIAGDLCERNIPLKLGAKIVQQCPYKLNLKYKEKVKVEIDTTLDEGLIESVE
jgi:hypothetical protein